ncbi:hypothetical protein CEUSTIGMA_g5507.t1 [Chlamydomonas eustigma]|uniref:Uncharacterized protein n=1 Tax=Chlamydomonas eustigma TaxID=1157962 RepID=A0A250X4R5_9CHLO|nr:hypothetical protein CEUSTIGMA_g5507.t1 [Chlamydomonas eustigma]|eukprot:GAX78065.1 hypothetical protein CEUSTIGMA_g5507.t1 [Chlamydomonas eustigma]
MLPPPQPSPVTVTSPASSPPRNLSNATLSCTIPPPADCNGHGALQNCTCNCSSGYANDFTNLVSPKWCVAGAISQQETSSGDRNVNLNQQGTVYIYPPASDTNGTGFSSPPSGVSGLLKSTVGIIIITVVALSLASCCGWFVWRKCRSTKRKRRQDSTLSEISSSDSSCSEDQASQKRSKRSQQKMKGKALKKKKKKGSGAGRDSHDVEKRPQNSKEEKVGAKEAVISHTNYLYTAAELSKPSSLQPNSSPASHQMSTCPPSPVSWQYNSITPHLMPAHPQHLSNADSPYFQSPLFDSPIMTPQYTHGRQDPDPHTSLGIMHFTPQPLSSFHARTYPEGITSNQERRMQEPTFSADGPSY